MSLTSSFPIFIPEWSFQSPGYLFASILWIPFVSFAEIPSCSSAPLFFICVSYRVINHVFNYGHNLCCYLRNYFWFHLFQILFHCQSKEYRWLSIRLFQSLPFGALGDQEVCFWDLFTCLLISTDAVCCTFVEETFCWPSGFQFSVILREAFSLLLTTVPILGFRMVAFWIPMLRCCLGRVLAKALHPRNGIWACPSV